MEKLERIRKMVREKLSGLFSTDRPMTAKEKWLIFLLGGMLLALVLWPQSKTGSSGTQITRSASGGTEEGSTVFGGADFGSEAGEKQGDTETGSVSDGEESGSTAFGSDFDFTGSGQDYADYLSQRLTAYLSQMEGAGEVTAWVTLESGEQTVLYEEETSQTSTLSEADSQGGTREENTENVTRTVVFGADGNPYVVQT
ncbi:MAG: hypothetical protein LUH58_06885, partial [Lachnospiraceae bacterium]|nr:hypothetical protein [Lachnospiraceae bacterium]